jgi:DNA polymerase-3 subunit epsilon
MNKPTVSHFDSYKFAASVAAATMAQCWLEHDAVILDTETTGLDWGCEVVEISIIQARTGLILMNTLVRPVNPIPAEATAIHGITNEMVEDAPLFFDVAISVARILSGRTVIAYNSAFDKKMLCSSAAYSSGEPPYVNSDFQCAMLAYAQFKGDWNHGQGSFKWHSLVNAAKQQEIELEGTAHRALYDCQLTRALILKMAAE